MRKARDRIHVCLETSRPIRGISAALSAAAVAREVQRNQVSRQECRRAHRDRWPAFLGDWFQSSAEKGVARLAMFTNHAMFMRS